MYPDLSYLLHDLIGTQPDNWTSIFKMFGFLLVLSILTAAWFLYLELKRKAEEGHMTPRQIKVRIGEPASPFELIANGLYGFILGFKGGLLISNFREFQLDPIGNIFSWEGNWIAGIGLAIFFAGINWYQKNRERLPEPKTVLENEYPHHRVGDIAVVAAVSGVLGAKLFASFESVGAMQAFFADPIGVFFSGSGLAIYGGLIIGFLTLTWYIRKMNIPFWHFFDALGPAFIFSMAVGRMGCQLSGDGDWGIAAAEMPEWWMLPDWMWSYEYPQNVNNEGVPMAECAEEYNKLYGKQPMSREEICKMACGINYCNELDPKVYPTPIYETIMFTGIGSFLWWLRKKITVPGIIFFITLFFSGIERYLIEAIRVNDKIAFLGAQWTQAELISIALVLIGTIGASVLWSRRLNEPQEKA